MLHSLQIWLCNGVMAPDGRDARGLVRRQKLDVGTACSLVCSGNRLSTDSVPVSRVYTVGSIVIIFPGSVS